MARPIKPDCDKRSQRFNLRVTPTEMQQIIEQADALGIEPHDYSRRRILGHRIKPVAVNKHHAALLSEINRVGVNVNQLARAVHRGRDFVTPWRQVQDELSKILSKVSASYDP